MTPRAAAGRGVAVALLCAAAGCGTASGPDAVPRPPSSAGPAAQSAAPPAGAGGTVPPPAADARDVSGPAPFVPAYLVLPSGRRAPVQPAGTAADGALTVPADPAQVGWWTGGARVGDPFGGIVLAGHIDSRRYGIGVLAELARARPGQQVTVGAGGRSRTFRITRLAEVPKARLTSGTDAFAQDVQPRLVLITCSGRFDPVRRAYEDNLVVVAEPVG